MQRKTQDGQPSRMTITTVAKTLLFDCSVLQQRGHCAPENNTLKYFYYVKIHFNDKVTIHRYIEEVSDFFFFLQVMLLVCLENMDLDAVYYPCICLM